MSEIKRTVVGTVHINRSTGECLEEDLDRLRQENERLKGEVEELKAKLKDAYLPSSAHIQDIYELTSHKQALEVARVALGKAQRAYRIRHAPTSDLLDSYPTDYDDIISTINNVLKEGK